MTKQEITQLAQTGHKRTEAICLSHIDCIPVWVDDDIQLIDMYLKDGKWIGSRRTFRYCNEENEYYASKVKI